MIIGICHYWRWYPTYALRLCCFFSKDAIIETNYAAA